MGDTDAGRRWRLVTDGDRIRALAERHEVVPIERGDGDGDRGDRDATARGGVVGLRRLPGAAGAPGEQLTWDAFGDRFDATEQFVAYRPPEPTSGEAAVFDVVDRGAVAGWGSASAKTRDPGGVDRDQLATSDTGDDEPVVFDRTETEGGESDGDADAVARTDATASTSDALDSATSGHGGLVLDEIREGGSGPGDDAPDGSLVFVNEGARPIDLSGWTVENEAGRIYEFPAGTDLAPGERLTLHSGTGDDAADELYWGASEPVWDDRSDTVIVGDVAGDRVVHEPYEA